MPINALDWSGTTVSDALKKLNLEGAGQKMKVKFMETIIDKTHEIAKATAPVGGDRDPHPGQLRDSISKDITEGRYLIRGRVFIPASIPYRFAVIFGDKRHNANRFMEMALVLAYRHVRKLFSSIVRQSIAEARK